MVLWADGAGTAPWNSEQSISEEVFGDDRFRQHARSLALAQTVGRSPRRVVALKTRLDQNVRALQDAHRRIEVWLASGHALTPAAEWLVNNSHVVEELVSQIRQSLPDRYYNQLPKLVDGPLAGYPRIFSIAWAYVAHTDSQSERQNLKTFVAAYQDVTPLSIGELWALPISINLVLVENLRRASGRVIKARNERLDADQKIALHQTSKAAISDSDFDLIDSDDGQIRRSYAVQLLRRVADIEATRDEVRASIAKAIAAFGLTPEDIVNAEHQSVASTNSTVRHIVRSMRTMADVQWASLVEELSLVDAELRKSPAYGLMDFATRNAYRTEIEALARRCSRTEVEIAKCAVETAFSAPQDTKRREPGYYLIGRGRFMFRELVGFRYRLSDIPALIAANGGLAGYVASIVLLTTLIAAVPITAALALSASAFAASAIAMLAVWPAMELAVVLVNHAVTHEVQPMLVPGLRLRDGIPDSARTFVVIPTLFGNRETVDDLVVAIETHYLATQDDNVFFALLSDWTDSTVAQSEADGALLDYARDAIARLNQTYSPSRDGLKRFYLFHRKRLWNASQGKWMGWERKRGKLHEFNRLLRNGTGTSFLPGSDGACIDVPRNVKYVITLDSDTRLPFGAVRRLVGKMEHPLNIPEFSDPDGAVVDGHAILQPRITASLPAEGEATLYQKLYSTGGGIDPYAGAISDVYHDLFGQGSYTGKGIYHVDLFERSAAGHFPENAILSHDLIEGIYARAGLASDVEFIEEFPNRYDVARSREHRWTRGDWQLLPWLFGLHAQAGKLSHLGRWKIFDNLRRSITPMASVAGVFLSLALLPGFVAVWTVLVAVTLLVPSILGALSAAASKPSGITLASHSKATLDDLSIVLSQSMMSFVLLADRAYSSADAIIRTLFRLVISRKNLLEWTTAAQAKAGSSTDAANYIRAMLGAMAIGAGVISYAAYSAPEALPYAVAIGVIWLSSPLVARWATLKPIGVASEVLSEDGKAALRAIGRETWGYFEAFVTPEDNDLPPDNFQEEPQPKIAHRTSPSNVGLYLLSVVSARELGWITLSEASSRLELTLRTLGRMPRYEGHFYNWYDTQTLEVLAPPYVSSVDSGNLAGHLLAVASACRQWIEQPIMMLNPRNGLSDAVHAADNTLQNADARARQFVAVLQMASRRTTVDAKEALAAAASLQSHLLSQYHPSDGRVLAAQATMRAIGNLSANHAADQTDASALKRRLLAIADTAEYFFDQTNFSILVDKQRNLFSVGLASETGKLDESCYDLLASEARLTSLIAIAKGDVETRHWFRLGRTVLSVAKTPVLTSWSGSMFEYLMPELVTATPNESLIGQSIRVAVTAHIAYGKRRNTPWGISESAFHARDLEFNYQYSSNGIPELGLKRGLSDSHVIAPYATALAADVFPRLAVHNFIQLAAAGGRGQYGFYDAIDYTAARLPEGVAMAVIKNYMAHHQGMTIVALTNATSDGVIKKYFHGHPLIRAAELLLHERAPRLLPERTRRATLLSHSATDEILNPSAHRIGVVGYDTPDCHVLSNSHLNVMVSGAGTGYITWNGLAVTRWEADATLDSLGSFIYLRDCASGGTWSVGQQPTRAPSDAYECIFSEERVRISRRDGTLQSSLDIVVSPEDDAIGRRLTLKNIGRTARQIDVTTYDELVLGDRKSDGSHPAFSKLFVETAFDAERQTLFASRRKRSAEDKSIAAATFVVCSQSASELEFETDRGAFLGRNRSLGAPRAVVSGLNLRNSQGFVLDPAFALRKRVTVKPGESVILDFWTLVGDDRALLSDLVNKYNSPVAFGRTASLAWTRSLMELRHLGISAESALNFQRLAGIVFYGGCDALKARRPLPGQYSFPDIWPAGISGDLPICAVVIEDDGDIALVRELLHAYEYWQSKHIDIDLVIINEHVASYQQELQHQLECALQTVSARHSLQRQIARGRVHVLRKDLIGERTYSAIVSAARVVLSARRGALSEQLEKSFRPSTAAAPSQPASSSSAGPATDQIEVPSLEFWNGYGGFADNGREYVVVLDGSTTTPAPWVNVISNESIGFQISAEGAGYTWAVNARERQLTPWSNDSAANRPGEVIYLRDEDSGELWSATSSPIRNYLSRYVVRHGHGYSQFENAQFGISTTLDVFVAPSDPVKMARLTLHNRSAKPRRIAVTQYLELILGQARQPNAVGCATRFDASLNGIFTQNSWHSFYPDRVAFSLVQQPPRQWTTDRRSFLGTNGRLDRPAGLVSGQPLGGASDTASDTCSVLQTVVNLAPGARAEVTFVLGDAADFTAAEELARKYLTIAPNEVLQGAREVWREVTGGISIETPDRGLDILVNGWLPYQTLSARLWGRSGFYQAGGAYGFRDQLQDTLSFLMTRPSLCRQQIVRAAHRQFIEGDVLHWWLEPTGHGIRTRISDSCLWLPFVIGQYIEATGDTAFLDEMVPFVVGPVLAPHEHEVYMRPEASCELGSIFEHGARAIDRTMAVGRNGLALIGAGDWNDGMNRLGLAGEGESVWLSWFIIKTIAHFAPMAEARGEALRAQHWTAFAERLRTAIESSAWDGNWHRRATFDDGSWIGSAASAECKIDAIAQSWSVISGAGTLARSVSAMGSVQTHLIDETLEISKLFTPPFDEDARDPGYIKGYPVGVRENGAQYTHAAAWNVIAFADLGQGDQAAALLRLINPIYKTQTRAKVQTYRVEPYVIAADVYSEGANAGRGGWTWYTGSAGWIFKSAVESLLGIRRRGEEICVRPRIPATWPGYKATLRLNGATIRITVNNEPRPPDVAVRAMLNGRTLAVTPEGAVALHLDGSDQHLELFLCGRTAATG